MATMLPVIKQAANKPLVSGPQQLSFPAVQGDKVGQKSKQMAGSPVVVVRRMMNKKEHELQQRMLAARAKLPQLTEWQTDE